MRIHGNYGPSNQPCTGNCTSAEGLHFSAFNYYLKYCIPRKYNVPLIITNLTSALNSLKFLDVNVLRYAHAHVRHMKNRYHKGTLKWQD